MARFSRDDPASFYASLVGVPSPSNPGPQAGSPDTRAAADGAGRPAKRTRLARGSTHTSVPGFARAGRLHEFRLEGSRAHLLQGDDAPPPEVAQQQQQWQLAPTAPATGAAPRPAQLGLQLPATASQPQAVREMAGRSQEAASSHAGDPPAPGRAMWSTLQAQVPGSTRDPAARRQLEPGWSAQHAATPGLGSSAQHAATPGLGSSAQSAATSGLGSTAAAPPQQCSPAWQPAPAHAPEADPAATATLVLPPRAAHATQLAGGRGGGGPPTAAAGHSNSTADGSQEVRYTIPASNIGFKLLKQAGWQEGTGLGSSQQGRLKPLLPHMQQGTHGLGFDSGTDPAGGADKQRKRVSQQQQQGHPAAATGTAAGAVGAQRQPNRIAEMAAAEIKAEDVSTRVKRHRQVMRQEQEDMRGRAIHQYLLRQFSEPDTSAVHKPLAGPTRLTATNPLL